MNRVLLHVISFLSLFLAFEAHAQPAWPARPIRIIVPFGPGAFTDVSARVLAVELTGQLGQQVVVENRTGAGGTIGTELAARATPDGYTLLLSDNSFAISPGLYAKLPYDPLRDFIHVSQIAESPSLMSGRIKLPAKTLQELVSLARANPGKLTFGSGGQGSSAHLAMELFLNVAGVKMLHVPFKGIGPALAEAVADRIDVLISSLAAGAPHIHNERTRGYAVSGKERHPILPGVPTYTEAGFPNYDMSYWWGIAAPVGTAPAIVARLNREIARAADKSTVRDVFQKQGAVAITSTPAALTRRVNAEIQTWKDVIAKAGVKLE
jgi:tripartite-type tricarboxylate transporter receptor subunit TctC